MKYMTIEELISYLQNYKDEFGGEIPVLFITREPEDSEETLIPIQTVSIYKPNSENKNENWCLLSNLHFNVDEEDDDIV